MTYSLTPDVISANKPLVSKRNSASIVELLQAMINIKSVPMLSAVIHH